MNFASMKGDKPFEGYSEETFDFLWGIRMNNNRDWFQAHKQQYVDSLYEPTKALAREVFARFDQPNLLCKVSRIYRDARLHHPDPYKESLWMCIRQDVEWWAENPTLYFEIRPEGAAYGFVFWKPKVEVMERFRQENAADPSVFSALLKEAEEKVGVPFTAQSYKRPKECENPNVGPWYNWRMDIECTVHLDPGPELFDRNLPDRVADHLLALLPVNNYFSRLV